MSETPKTYSLRLKEEPVIIEDAAGNPQKFSLRELCGTERDKYLNEIARRLNKGRKGDNGQVRDVSGLPALLLSYSLYTPENQRLDPKLIDTWPSAMQMDLFRRALKLSGLSDEEQDMEDAKNG